ncbi:MULTISPECIES: hypothetical protein [unclassified Mycobacterium]|uniref:hypothetical protein n=1 Tax=unclassified Mycobacterium TaxID=2642494 RepID=UPI0029C853AE|nr:MULTISPECIES: hypothetical protein [unclassified Mycobacterium]
MNLPNAQVRQYIYGIVVATIPVLLLLSLITPEQVGAWLQLAAAILGLGATGTAGVAVTQQRRSGTLD